MKLKKSFHVLFCQFEFINMVHFAGEESRDDK